MRRFIWELRYFAMSNLLVWACRVMPPDVSIDMLQAMMDALDAASKDEYLSDEGKPDPSEPAHD